MRWRSGGLIPRNTSRKPLNSPAAIERARQVLGALAAKVVLADFFAHDFGGSQFDVIYARTFLCLRRGFRVPTRIHSKQGKHTFPGAGNNWGSSSWDHLPIVWLTSQSHLVGDNSLKLYPNHFSPVGMDSFALPNAEAARGVYYSLIGVGGDDLEAVRAIARRWLQKGESAIGRPDSPADLPRP